MNESPAWLWLAGILLIALGIVLSVVPLVYAVFVMRKFHSRSGMRNWAEVNLIGLILGFLPPVGAALVIQGGKFIGQEFDQLLIPVVYICIPILAVTIMSSFTRLIWSGISGPRRGRVDARADKPKDSSPDGSEAE